MFSLMAEKKNYDPLEVTLSRETKLTGTPGSMYPLR